MIQNINKLTELEKENLGIEDNIEDSKFMVNREVMEDDTEVLTLEKIIDATGFYFVSNTRGCLL